MNFEKLEALYDETAAQYENINQEIEKLKRNQAEAKNELESVGSTSRQFFLINEELKLLEKELTRLQNKKQAMISSESPNLKRKLERLRDELFSSMEEELKEKYQDKIADAVDQVIDLANAYSAAEQLKKAEISSVIHKFNNYDDGKFPSLTDITGKNSYGYAYVVLEETKRISTGQRRLNK